MLKNPAVKTAYDAQADEFVLLDELLKARRRAGMTQAEVAQRMGHEDSRSRAPGSWRRQQTALAVKSRPCANMSRQSVADSKCGYVSGDHDNSATDKKITLVHANRIVDAQNINGRAPHRRLADQ